MNKILVVIFFSLATYSVEAENVNVNKQTFEDKIQEFSFHDILNAPEELDDAETRLDLCYEKAEELRIKSNTCWSEHFLLTKRLNELQFNAEVSQMNMLDLVTFNTGMDNNLATALSLLEEEFQKLRLSEKKDLQLVLKARGLYGDAIDGVWGENTKLGLKLYLIRAFSGTSAQNPTALFDEIKQGFLIESLWSRENYEAELQSVVGSRTSLNYNVNGINNPSLSKQKSKPSRSYSLEPFFNGSNSSSFVKNMFINGELETCLKVGSTWECD